MPPETDYQSLPSDAVTKPKKGAAGKESRDARAAKILGKRISLAAAALQEKIDQGEMYRRYIVGVPPKATDGATPQTEAKDSIGTGWNRVSIPAHGMLTSVLTPSLVSRKPTYINRARKSANEAERARGRIYSELAKVIEDKSDVHSQVTAALEDCYPNTVGWLFVDYDPEIKLPAVRQVPCSRVLVDQETDGRGFMKDVRWIAERRGIPANDARWLADNVWGAKGYEFKPVENAWDDEDESGGSEIGEVPTKFAKLLYLYLAGNNPYTARADLSASPDAVVERSSEDPAYSGKDELIIMECRGEEDDATAYKIVARQPWAFPAMPGTPLRLTMPDKGFYPPSVLQPSHELQVFVSWAATFYSTDVYNSARRIVSYNKSIFKSDKELKRAFSGGDNLGLVGGERAIGQEDLKVVTFGQPNPALGESISVMTGIMDQVSGKVAFDAEQRNRSHQTATGAAISNESAQVRMGRLADLVEKTYQEVMEKALMCARANMSAEDVAAWVGEDLMHMVDTVAEDGTPVRESNLWDDSDRSPEAIRKEVDIDIEPRSVRFVSPEQEVNDIQLLMDKQVLYSKEVKGALDAQMPEFARALAKAGNASILALAERLHLANAEDYVIDLSMIVPPPPPPQPNAGMPGQLPTMGGPSMMQRMTRKADGTTVEEVQHMAGDTPHPGGGPTPQALGEILQMVQQGIVKLEQLPPDIQAAITQMVSGGGGGPR